MNAASGAEVVDVVRLSVARSSGTGNVVLANCTVHVSGVRVEGCALVSTPLGRRLWAPACKQREGQPFKAVTFAPDLFELLTELASQRFDELESRHD